LNIADKAEKLEYELASWIVSALLLAGLAKRLARRSTRDQWQHNALGSAVLYEVLWINSRHIIIHDVDLRAEVESESLAAIVVELNARIHVKHQSLVPRFEHANVHTSCPRKQTQGREAALFVHFESKAKGVILVNMFKDRLRNGSCKLDRYSVANLALHAR